MYLKNYLSEIMNMNNYKFEDGEYLVVLSDDSGEYDCYSCNSENEVFQVLSKRIIEELEYLFNEDAFNGNSFWTEDDKDFAETIYSTGIIKDYDAINDAYNTFFADSWSYLVIDTYGDVISSRRL